MRTRALLALLHTALLLLRAQGLQETGAIPPGVHCAPHRVCTPPTEGCSVVCRRGSVVVDPWLSHALRYQRQAAANRSLCQASLPGSHNSAITLADGYGNRNLQLVPGSVRNNQFLSLTDQLNLGVRLLELDVHLVRNELLIAHCGGLHLPWADRLLARLGFQYDSETVGCLPSLSGIPVEQQRTFDDALAEVALWLDANPDELLVLFLDDDQDLQRWGAVPALEASLLRALRPTRIVRSAGGPAMNDTTVAELAGRVVVASGAGGFGSPWLFDKHALCGWNEPAAQLRLSAPLCVPVGSHTRIPPGGRTITRPETSELVPGSHGAFALNETTIPPLLDCGVNAASPDLVVPSRMAAQVWSWAVGQFPAPWATMGSARSGPGGARWTGGCTAALRACFHSSSSHSPDSHSPDSHSPDSHSSDSWILAEETCPAGSVMRAPATAWENGELKRLISRSGATEVCFPAALHP